MKKILVTFAFVSSLIFSLAACARANSVYLDSAVFSDWRYGTHESSIKRDLNEITLGGDYSFEKFLAVLEYSSGNEKHEGGSINWNYDKIYFKGGYDFLSNEHVKLAGTVGYFARDYDNNANTKLDGILVGVDCNYQINAKNILQGSVDVSPMAGKYKEDGKSDSDNFTAITTLKYTYLLTDNLGISIGYRDTRSKIHDDSDPDNKYKQRTRTVGLTYKF